MESPEQRCPLYERGKLLFVVIARISEALPIHCSGVQARTKGSGARVYSSASRARTIPCEYIIRNVSVSIPERSREETHSTREIA